MRPLDHRDPGILGEVLTDSRLSAEIIADGIHVDPVIVQLFLKAKGPEAAVLVTDATAATGMPDGRYHLGSLEVEVKDGRCMVGDSAGGQRADHGPRSPQRHAASAQWNLPQAVRLATLNPARVAGVPQRRLTAGRHAGRSGGVESGRRSEKDDHSRSGDLVATKVAPDGGATLKLSGEWNG